MATHFVGPGPRSDRRRSFVTAAMCAVFAVVLDVPVQVKGTEPALMTARPSKEQIEATTRAVAALRVGRERLSSGQYKVTVIASHALGGTPAKIESRRDVAFNLSAGLLRQDFRFTDRKEGAGQYINTPTQSLIVTNDEKALERHVPGFFPSGMVLRPFDVRLFGLIGLVALFQHPQDFESYFKGIESQIQEGGLVADEVGSASERMVRLQMRGKNGYGQHIVLDPSKGYSPIHWEEWFKIEKSASGDSPDSELDVTWQTIDGLWVPAQATHQRNGGAGQRYEVAFEWGCVNCEPPATLFEEGGLALAPDAWVIDQRGKVAIVEGKALDSGKPRSQGGLSSRWFGNLLKVNAAIATMIGLLFLRRKISAR